MIQTNLDLIYRGEYYFGNGLILPIKIHIKDIDDFMENENDSNSSFSYIYKINNIRLNNLKYFNFIDIDIVNDKNFEIQVKNDIYFETSTEGVDYKIEGDTIKFITPQSIIDLVESQNSGNFVDVINGYKMFINKKIGNMVNKYISLLKESIGNGDKNWRRIYPMYIEFMSAYGKDRNSTYFEENSPSSPYSTWSFRERLAKKFFTSRDNEISNLQQEEQDKKLENMKKKGR